MIGLMTLGLAVAVVLGACAGAGGSDSAASELQEIADREAIEELQVKFHEASSKKDVDLLASLFADDAVMTVASQTYSGKEEIRRFYATQAASFKPGNRWISLTPAHDIRVTVDGDRGTLYFECHYVDLDTRQVVVSLSADAKVARAGGDWVMTSAVAGNALLR